MAKSSRHTGPGTTGTLSQWAGVVAILPRSASDRASTIHCESFRSVPGTEVVAVTSATEAHARAFAERHGIPRWFTDYRKMYELPDLDAENVADRLHRGERAVMVRRALQALPAEMRQVIIMKEYHEMTFAEIAEVMQIPVSTVKSRLYTGLQQMRARLEKLRSAI